MRNLAFRVGFEHSSAIQRGNCMKSILFTVAFLVSSAGVVGAPKAVEAPRTVVAKVKAFEHYRALGGAWRFSQVTPYGNEDTVVAIILSPESLAGREIAIPFESQNEGRELLVQPGTIFRFEHRMNLADLRSQTDWVRRRAIEFPALGIVALKNNGDVGESYPGSLTPLAKP